MFKKKKIIAIVGPTASGKTTLSILLAKKLSGEVISADSRQLFKHLKIGVAKPSIEELNSVKHHFIDFLEPTQDFNAAEYGQQARLKIEELLKRGSCPIVVGGSGLYIKSIIDGFFEGPGKNSELRDQLEYELEKYGNEALFKKLIKVDPVSASKMDPSKVRRIIRALEVYYTTGNPISEHHKVQSAKSNFDVIQFGLEWERKLLYERINNRVDKMITDGLIDEVKELIAKGYSRQINALNTVGYKEVFDFLLGENSKEEMIELIKQNTRRYAKRQMTWFKADKRIKWIKVSEQTDWNNVAELVMSEYFSEEKSF